MTEGFGFHKFVFCMCVVSVAFETNLDLEVPVSLPVAEGLFSTALTG